MNLPRSSYYYRPKSRATSSEQRVLTARIEEIAEEFPRYGYRKVTAQLRREGLLVNHKKIQRIMRERGWELRDTVGLSGQPTASIPIPSIRT